MGRILLCFGDSNTHGTPPMDQIGEPYRRFGPGIRWPHVALSALGPDWSLVEEGLPGRTAQYDDPVMGPQMNGQQGLKIALQSHGPIDALTIMLGTNDTKACFGASPATITGGIAGLLNIALSLEMQERHGGFKVLLICPPPVEEAGCLAGIFYGGRQRALALPELYQGLATALGVGFLDAGKVLKVSPVDGVHYDEAGHAALGQAVAGGVAGLFGR
jgi:lysophospholipase L1-like esterase